MGAGKWMLALPMALGFLRRLTVGVGRMAPGPLMASCGFLRHARGARSLPLQVRGGFLGFQAPPEASVGGGGRHACHRGRVEEVHSRGEPQSCLSARLLSETSCIIAISFPFSSKHREEK